MKRRSCLVIGAGISGLLSARALQDRGWDVTVVDKGRGVGGRLATRRVEDAVFDHGAQFITVRDPVFAALVRQMLDAGVLYEWCRGIGTPEETNPDDGHPRYQGTGGMSAIAKYLAIGLDVRVRHKVAQLRVADGRWQARLESGQLLPADAVISTTPVPQALDLLDLGGFEMAAGDRRPLAQLKYHPCIALLAILNGPTQLPGPGAIRLGSGPISLITDNQRKGISPHATAVTIHTTPEFSREHFRVDEHSIAAWVLEQAGRYLASQFVSWQVHRWRFSMPAEPHPERALRIQSEPPLVFAGDAFGGPRVEGAALSGLAAAQALSDAF